MRKRIKTMGKRLMAILLAVITVWSFQVSNVSAVNANGAIAQGVDVSKHKS